MTGIASNTYFSSTTSRMGMTPENRRKRGSFPSWARMRRATRPISPWRLGIDRSVLALADERDEGPLERVVANAQLLDSVGPPDRKSPQQPVRRIGKSFHELSSALGAQRDRRSAPSRQLRRGP